MELKTKQNELLNLKKQKLIIKNTEREHKIELDGTKWGVEIKDKYAFEVHRENYRTALYFGVILYIGLLFYVLSEVLR